MVDFERSSKPWFGPKKRARELLSNRTDVLDPHHAVKAIEDQLGADATLLQHVRFVDFVHKDNGFRFTIAIIWTASQPLCVPKT
jgi:hypothetical protein